MAILKYWNDAHSQWEQLATWDGSGIQKCYINSNGHLIIELYNGTIQDCGEVNSSTGALDVKIVDELPTTGISTTTLYLVPCENAEGTDNYDEYLYVGGTWERMGTTDAAIEVFDDSSATTDEIDDII